MRTENLWPLIKASEQKFPKEILKEQAEYLSASSSGVLLGEVISGEKEHNGLSINITTKEQKIVSLRDNDLLHSLYVTVPKMNNYRFELLRITHRQLIPYPLSLRNSIKGSINEAKNEEEFIALLKEVFNSKEILDTLSLLMAQVR